MFRVSDDYSGYLVEFDNLEDAIKDYKRVLKTPDIYEPGDNVVVELTQILMTTDKEVTAHVQH